MRLVNMITNRRHTIRLSDYKNDGLFEQKAYDHSRSIKTTIIEPPRLKSWHGNENSRNHCDCVEVNNHYATNECVQYNVNLSDIQQDDHSSIANCCQLSNRIPHTTNPHPYCCCCTCYHQDAINTKNNKQHSGENCASLAIDKLDCDSITNQLSALVLNFDRYKPFADSRRSQRQLKVILPIYFKMLMIISTKLDVRRHKMLLSPSKQNHHFNNDYETMKRDVGAPSMSRTNQMHDESNLIKPIQRSRVNTLRYIESLDGYSSSTNTLRLILKSPTVIYAINAYEDIINQL